MNTELEQSLQFDLEKINRLLLVVFGGVLAIGVSALFALLFILFGSANDDPSSWLIVWFFLQTGTLVIGIHLLVSRKWRQATMLQNWKNTTLKAFSLACLESVALLVRLLDGLHSSTALLAFFVFVLGLGLWLFGLTRKFKYQLKISISAQAS